MATHKITVSYEILFEDGSIRKLEIPSGTRAYHFQDQKYKYLILWLEAMMERENITVKPIQLREVYNIVETEPYEITIGL